ncbi:5825_t:CDS:2, partial [Gigaspora margarita]
ERHLQSLYDMYHTTSGKVLKLLTKTIDAFLVEGKSAFIAVWKLFEYPKNWYKLPNLITHIDSFMMFDCLRLAIVFSFIINELLKPQYFKQSEIYKLQQQLNLSCNNLAIKVWLKCWLIVSKTMAFSFKKYFTEEDYIELQHAKNYANLLNIGIGTKEMHLQHLMNNWFIFGKPDDVEDNINKDFKEQLVLCYEDLGYLFVVFNSTPLFFEYANVYIKKDNLPIQYYLHIGDIVSINSEEDDKSFSIICAIFCDRKGKHYFTFIIIDCFERMNQTKLGCPLYSLQTTTCW